MIGAMDVNFPISRSQEALRSIPVRDMNVLQLRDWIDACERMSNWPGMKLHKGRKFWRQNLAEANAELERRGLSPDG